MVKPMAPCRNDTDKNSGGVDEKCSNSLGNGWIQGVDESEGKTWIQGWSCIEKRWA